MALPALFADPDSVTPIVPLYIDLSMSPLPSPQRCQQLGEVLGEFINGPCRSAERVVVMGLPPW